VLFVFVFVSARTQHRLTACAFDYDMI
jgi:hypothetical protein